MCQRQAKCCHLDYHFVYIYLHGLFQHKNIIQELSERGQLESALGLSKKAVTPVQSVPIIYPEKRKKRTIKEFRAEKERNQRTFYNLKGIGRGLELVLNDVPCEFNVCKNY